MFPDPTLTEELDECLSDLPRGAVEVRVNRARRHPELPQRKQGDEHEPARGADAGTKRA